MVIPGPLIAALTAPAGGAPLTGRAAAQRLAREELTKRIYHPQQSLAGRVLGAILRWLDRLFPGNGPVPGGWWAVVALAALVVLAAGAIMAWLGPVGRAHRRAVPVAAGAPLRTAAEHRREAARLAEAGDYAGAIRESVRAIAAELDERAVLPARRGRTADELAAEAGQVMPALAGALRSAAVAFDEVCYGHRPGTAAGYQQVRELGSRVAESAGRASRQAGEGQQDPQHPPLPVGGAPP
ncbi:MAG: DUF4129 domain-containing protein [Nocardiopsaceae bacterium]|nr:DUF4129 domain-containing protein [Nocardiopsaceae bacterium]